MRWHINAGPVTSGADAEVNLTFLLDTNSLIYYFQGASQMDAVFQRIEQGTARPAVSIITVVELLGYHGLTRHDETRIRTLLSRFAVLAVDERVAAQAVILKRRHRLKTPDAIVAATALVEKACLVTRDGALLDKVREIETLNPFAQK
jgi:predicted nucleic acid-binding protein